MAFTVTFRGVRGTVPVSQPEFMRYGGHTSCVEVRCGERLIILDAGTGIRQVGQQDAIKDADILLSHTHIDHVIGLLFFQPLFKPHAQLRVWAGHLLPHMRLEQAISRLMSPPLFPLTQADLKADIQWRDFKAGEPLDGFSRDGISIATLPLSHPDNATGYRITYQGRSMCYLTDMEHEANTLDPAVVSFIRDADLLIYDSTYDDREFATYKGWGHSTWQQAARFAEAGKVKTLALFHHDHAADDSILAAREAELQKTRPGWIAAREQLTISI